MPGSAGSSGSTAAPGAGAAGGSASRLDSGRDAVRHVPVGDGDRPRGVAVGAAGGQETEGESEE